MQSITPFRRFYIEHVIIFFPFPEAKIIPEIQAKALRIAFTVAARIHRTLLKSELVIISEKDIPRAERYRQFLLQELLGYAHVQLSERAQLIKLQLAVQSCKAVQCDLRERSKLKGLISEEGPASALK